jgi:threonine dehydratase
MSEITLEHIRDAAARIRPLAHSTPVMTSQTFDREVGAQVFFKCENFQRGGAFKIRGAANFILSMPRESVERGVVAFSSGNHAQAVAIAARYVGAPATIVMPTDAPHSKVEATRGYGASIITYDRLREDREVIGRRIAGETGATLIPPFDNPSIIAGQGTAALELLEQVPDLDALVSPIGGGGLLAGCATASRALNPGIRLFGVEPEDGNDTYLSMRSADRVEIPPPKTIADGLRSLKPGAITFPILQKLLEEIVLVTDDEIKAAVRFLVARLKIVVEPSGAVGPAALLARKLPAGGKRIGVILSGGNIDLDLLATLSTS